MIRARTASLVVRRLSHGLKIWERSYRNLSHFDRHSRACLDPALRSSSISRFRTLSTVPVPTGDNGGSNHLPTKLIDFSLSAKIEGEESQVAMVQLRPNEVLRAESGAMLFMTQGVEMDTNMQGSAFSRFMTGQNVFLTDFRYTSQKDKNNEGEDDDYGTVGLGTDFPSKIVRLSLQDYPDSALICQRGAFMASNPSVDIQMEFTKSFTSGFFGGQGFILQRLSGQGDVLVKAGGTLVVKDLKEGERIRVTSGSIVAFTSSVQYDVQMMPGIKNAMFGGEGLFVTTLTGPGKIWLQGMPADRMIAEIARRVPSGGGIGLGVPLGGGGGSSGEGTGEADGDVESGEEAVAATDAAVNADRQATIAASDMAGDDANIDSGPVDSDSPSALFGDAAPKQDPASAAGSSEPAFSPMDSSTDPSKTETTFSDDNSFSDTSDFTEETMFSDDNSFSTEDDFGSEDTGFDDSTTFDTGASEGSSDESGGGLFGTLWDLFTGGDDD